MAGHPLPVLRGHLLYGFRNSKLLALRKICIYWRRQTDRKAGGAVHRIQHRGPGDQPGLHVAVCGKIRPALHAGEDRRYFHRHVLELCDETQSGAGIDFCKSIFYKQAEKRISKHNRCP